MTFTPKRGKRALRINWDEFIRDKIPNLRAMRSEATSAPKMKDERGNKFVEKKPVFWVETLFSGANLFLGFSTTSLQSVLVEIGNPELSLIIGRQTAMFQAFIEGWLESKPGIFKEVELSRRDLYQNLALLFQSPALIELSCFDPTLLEHRFGDSERVQLRVVPSGEVEKSLPTPLGNIRSLLF